MKLVTHNGNFHYDEVLATVILTMIYPESKVTRSRDPKVIDEGDIIYDVGGVFDPETKRFDHHQKTFKETFSPEHSTKLSSAGLIYKYFCNELFKIYGFGGNHMLYEEIKLKVYNTFFLYADAIDNGQSIFGEIIPRTLASLVAGFNVYDCKKESELEALQNKAFNAAREIVQTDFLNYMNYIFKEFIPSYDLVYNEMKDLTGDIYITNLKGSTDLIFNIDEKLKKNLKYIIFKNKSDFRVLALPIQRGSFVTRAPLLEKWRGLRDDELSKISGIDGCLFVHATGFTGGNKTLNGAIKMCEKSLESRVKRQKESKELE